MKKLFLSQRTGLLEELLEIRVYHWSDCSMALLLLTKHSLFFVRITGEQKQFDLFDNIIPYYVRHLESDQIMVLAVMSHEDLSKSIANRLEIDILPLNLSIEDPMFVSIDHIDEHTPRNYVTKRYCFLMEKRCW